MHVGEGSRENIDSGVGQQLLRFQLKDWAPCEIVTIFVHQSYTIPHTPNVQ